MNNELQRVWEKSQQWDNSDDGRGKLKILESVEKFAELVRVDEREACAKLVDDVEARCIGKDVDDPPLSHVAAAIRVRSQS